MPAASPTLASADGRANGRALGAVQLSLPSSHLCTRHSPIRLSIHTLFKWQTGDRIYSLSPPNRRLAGSLFKIGYGVVNIAGAQIGGAAFEEPWRTLRQLLMHRASIASRPGWNRRRHGSTRVKAND